MENRKEKTGYKTISVTITRELYEAIDTTVTRFGKGFGYSKSKVVESILRSSDPMIGIKIENDKKENNYKKWEITLPADVYNNLVSIANISGYDESKTLEGLMRSDNYIAMTINALKPKDNLRKE